MTSPPPQAPGEPGDPIDDATREQIAELMAHHGMARYADAETVAACLRPRRGARAPGAPRP